MDLIDVSVGVAPMYDEGRNLVGISAIVSDIGERRARERPSECLMREVSHRSKNLLAVVQAIDSQTALHRITFDGFRHASQSGSPLWRARSLGRRQLDRRERGRSGAHPVAALR